MVKTASTMLPLGTPLPEFSLPEPLTDLTVSSSELFLENGLFVIFISNHCPFVIHLHQQLKELGTYLPQLKIGMVAIASNDIVNYPMDGPVSMKQHATDVFSTFKYLFDQTQNVAKSFKAACTPDAFLFDGSGKLVYRGQIDASRPGSGQPADGASIRAAANLLAEGKPIPDDMMKPAMGCNIKWKRGNEPDYST